MTDIEIALTKFPRVQLGFDDTPVEPLPRLGAQLGLDLCVKRDDCTGLAFGGNKTRQLEYYFGQALAEGVDTVLTTGAVQSNHVRCTAAAAAKLGLKAHVQLQQRVLGQDATYHASGNVLLDDLLGASRSEYPHGEDEAGADAALAALATKFEAAGRRCHIIPLSPGAKPLGALGYVRASLEIARLGRAFDAIVVGSGSGMTHVGLLLGLRALGLSTRVYGVCVRRRAELQRPRLERHTERLTELLGIKPVVKPSDILLEDQALGKGYGLIGEDSAAALLQTARLEGLLLDPVYTAKVMAGLVALRGVGELKANERVLFLHTGGNPALFGYATELGARALSR